MLLLQVSNLSKTINETVVLDNISFHFPSFRRLAVAGETGSGKTTLLKVISGLLQPSTGEVLFEGQKVPGPEEQLLPGHQRIAYLSQHFELRNNYRVADFLEMASKVGEQQARRIYELCQIDHLLKRKTDQLSGGERQRTALARLLTISPSLLVLDEPYSNLDGIHKEQLKEVVNNIINEGSTSCIIVSHDPVDVLPWAEEVLVMKNGSIIQQGTPQKVYRQPVNEYAGGLFGDYNLLSADQAKAIFGAKEVMENKQLFVRPESIQLARGEYGGQQRGFVTASYFFGSYVEAEVLFGNVTIKVKTLRPTYQKGDVVSANVTPEDVWLL